MYLVFEVDMPMAGQLHKLGTGLLHRSIENSRVALSFDVVILIRRARN